jgi:small conductance mechanosensitive channel
MIENVAERIVVSLETFGQWLSDWVNAHFIDILVILAGAWIFRRVSVELVTRLLKYTLRPDSFPTKSDREKRIKTLQGLASGVMRLVTYVIATILIISEVNPGYKNVLFTSAGLIGVVLGFGAQSLIRDILSGIFIIIENQYRIGDEISVSGGNGVNDVDGVVEDLTIRTTVLRDMSGNVHHIPNGNIGLTTNRTLGYSRMNENITVALDTNLEKLDKVLKQVGEDLVSDPKFKEIVLEPPYVASVKGFSENGVIIRVLAKTTPGSRRRVRSEFYRLLKKAFEKNKIHLAGQSETTETED